jgi:hypothetical protein
VLKAEYSYLTNPKRLRKLADKNLALRSPSNDQTLDANQIEIYLNPFVARLEESVEPLNEAEN